MRPWLCLTLAAAGISSACMEWKVTDRPLPVVLAKYRDSIRVTPWAGAQVVVARPELVKDSLLGRQVIGNGRADIPLRYAVADIARVEVWKTNQLKTTVAIIGTAASAGALLWMVKWRQDERYECAKKGGWFCL